MSKKINIQTLSLPDGRKITLEHGRLAGQADSSVVVQMGNKILLVAVTTEKSEEPLSFLPLTVNYQEHFDAAGRFPGGFMKREGRANEHETIISRLIDRSIRPCFPDRFCDKIQVDVMLLSADESVDPIPLTMLGVSSALVISSLPFDQPISAVRIIKKEGVFIINPTPQELKESEIDFILTANNEGNILMIEGSADSISNEEVLNTIDHAQSILESQCKLQKQFATQVLGKERIEQAEIEGPLIDKALLAEFKSACYEVAKKGHKSKKVYKSELQQIKQTYLKTHLDLTEEEVKQIVSTFEQANKEAIRELIFEEGVRADGRKSDEIRPIEIEIDPIPSAHGSAIFTRGETQTLTTITIGSSADQQIVDGVTEQTTKNIVTHYLFPAFSVGEVRPNRGPGRREIGHAELCYKAIKRQFTEDLAGAVRIKTQVISCNGSSSQATICGSSLALMDAGIPIKNAVAGIAMGVIPNKDETSFRILSDITGSEDAAGGIDLKVAGTMEGITALQLDIKLKKGLPSDIFKKALEQAQRGREHILKIMNASISQTRENYKPHAPKSTTIEVAADMIGKIIGPGGKVIQEIQKETGAVVNISDEDGQGIVSIFSSDARSIQDAKEWVERIVEEALYNDRKFQKEGRMRRNNRPPHDGPRPEIGVTYQGQITSIMPYGLFVEFLPHHTGLLHKSAILQKLTENIENHFEIGEKIDVVLTKIERGKFSLSEHEKN